MTGNIHSIQTLGLLDGPGIRIVVFMQGCPNRCLFCHNPDTWNTNTNIKMTPIELFNEIKKYKTFIESGGGVTISGGEPLLQTSFLIEVLKLCKKDNIHTCIDTSGNGYDKEKLEELLKYTDLILLDIKAINEDNYFKITKGKIDNFNYFLNKVQEHNKKLWLRQVIIPGINDDEYYILKLKEYIKNIKNVEKIELLPYSLIGINKYKDLKLNYPLDGIPPMDKKKCDKLQELLNKK